MLRPVFCLALLWSVAAGLSGQTLEERKIKIQEQDAAAPSKEALERKERSMQRLKKEGVLTLAKLPVIEDSKTAKTRSKEEIAKRAIALTLVTAKAAGASEENFSSLIKQKNMRSLFSPKEIVFLGDPKPNRPVMEQFSWRGECIWVLLWTLGYVDELGRPEKECDAEKIADVIDKHPNDSFLKDAKLRPIGEILDQADLIYRYHWAVVDSRVKGNEAPAKLNADVVAERHYVLNWLIGYLDQEWDEVSTDT